MSSNTLPAAASVKLHHIDGSTTTLSLTPETRRKRASRAEMLERREREATAMKQTRMGSLIEALINVAIGFGINFTANLLILPLIGFQISIGQNLFIGLLYTAISVARSYAIRRWFNGRIHAAALALARRSA